MSRSTRRPFAVASIPSIVLALVLVLLACAPGCSCSDDDKNAPDGSADAGPDPCAPTPITPAGALSFADTIRFLYDGACPRQTNTDKAVFDDLRVSVIHGRVLDEAGQPLGGARITVPLESRYGQALTHADGTFDYVINGDARTRLRFDLDGRLPSFRGVGPKANRFSVLDDLALIPKSATALPLTFGAPSWQTAIADESNDDGGPRRVRLLVPPGTNATLVKADGTTAPLDTGTLRITEFTKGTNGPLAMPSELPPASAYTYASSFRFDEEGDGDHVEFDRPVIAYLENFLGMQAGADVPSGSLEDGADSWQAQPSGRVVALTTGGAPALDLAGVPADEVATIAGIAPAGSYFRIPLTHFTNWDWNFGFGPPADAVAPPDDDPNGDPGLPCLHGGGSSFECERQVLAEDIALVGTGVGLHYQSDRNPGYVANNTLVIPVTPGTVPSSLKRADVTVKVAGVVTATSYPQPGPNINNTYTWDGKDVFGRTWPSETVAEVTVSLAYDGVYDATKSFAGFGSGVPITGEKTRKELLVSRNYEFHIGAFRDAGLGLGGWSLTNHHVYDRTNQTLYRGDGPRRNNDAIGAQISKIAGVSRNGSGGGDAPSVPVMQAHFGYVTSVAIDQAGALYVAETQGAETIRKIESGMVTVVAGVGAAAHSPDGVMAAQATINDPVGLVVLHDGRICFSEAYDGFVRCVGTDGVLRTLAGGGDQAPSSTPTLATSAQLSHPSELFEAPDGSIYLSNFGTSTLLRIDPAGTIELAVGGGDNAGESVPVLQAKLGGPRGITMGADGALYIAESTANRVRRVDPSGLVTTFAGSGVQGNEGDGGIASSAQLYTPTFLAFGADGALYLTDNGNARIRRIADAKIQPFAGGGDRASGPGAAARLSEIDAEGLVVAPDGTMYVGNDTDQTIASLVSPLPGGAVTDFLVPSDDGSEIFVFDVRGNHLKTLDGLTSDVVTTFTYDASGHLTRAEDRHGNALVLARDGSGNVTQITAPYGQTTTLAYSADGFLATVTDPIGRKENFGYAPGGLLSERTDAGGGVHHMAYDGVGRVVHDGTAENHTYDLTSDPTSTTVTSGLGRREVHTYIAGAGKDEQRTYVAPDGTVTPWVLRQDGTANVTLPNGTSIDIVRDADPRLGTIVPYASKHVVTLPSGLVRTITTQRSVITDDAGTITSINEESNTPDGLTQTTYDPAARVATTTSPVGRVSKTTLDGEGRVLRVENPGRMPIAHTYDDRGRVATIDEGGRTTTYSYDAQTGALIGIANPLNQAVGLARDGALRLSAIRYPDGAQSSRAWSAMDDPVGLAPAGKPSHVMAFDHDGNETTYTAPGSPPLSFSYDLDRALSGVVDANGGATSLVHDAAGRVSHVAYPGGANDISYDGKTGQLIALAAPTSSIAYAWDGVLLTSITTTGATSATVSFAYDAMLRGKSESIAGNALAYGYDQDGALAQAGPAQITRDITSGDLSYIDIGSLEQRYTETAYGEIASYASSGVAGNLLDVTLTHDALSRVTDRTENGDAYHYDYDVRGRLVHVTKNGGEFGSYTWDANGNRTDGGGASDDQDRLTAMNGATYTYSAAGERLTRTNGAGQTRYTYDGRGYLSSVQLPSGAHADYDLDAFGRRLTKSLNGAIQNRFVYRNALQPLADVDASGNVISLFAYARGELGPDVMVRAGVTYMLVKDERGSVRFVVDSSSGAVAQALTYDPFGKVLSDSSPGFQPFGYVGGIWDSDTGLLHIGVREYDPDTGIFTRKDPSRFWGGENVYAYAFGDPINLLDSDGEGAAHVGAGFIGGFIEGAVTGYADEAASQVLDKDFAGYDCSKIRSATLLGGLIGGIGGAVAARGQGCFAAGTEVATPDGSRAIETITPGDVVLSQDESGAASYARVKNVFVHEDAEQLALTFTDVAGVASSVVTTPEHPFRADGAWVNAGDLAVGGHVETAEGKLATLSAALSLEKHGRVWNLEVEGAHTYFVGEGREWVHNGCGDGRPRYVPRDDAGRPRGLPRGPHGELSPSSADPHTQIGWRDGRNGGYVQTREFGSNGTPISQVDWTDHGRPDIHTDPHVHDYVPNPSGGTPQHGPPRPYP